MKVTIDDFRQYAASQDWLCVHFGTWGTHSVNGVEMPKFVYHYVTPVGNHVYAYHLQSGEVVEVK